MDLPSVVIHDQSGFASTHFAQAAGIIETIQPRVDVDNCNPGIEKGNVRQISAYLFTNVPFWPDGTIFISFVGTGRPVAVKFKNGSILLSPDNGTCTMCAGILGISEARFLSEEFGTDGWQMPRCAARLADGMDFSEVGPEVPGNRVVLYKIPAARISEGRAEGEVSMLLKNFGNLTFSIGTDEFENTGIRHGDRVRVTFTRDGKVEWKGEMTFQPSFGYVPEGDPVIFNGSSGYMDIGLNRRHFINKCLPQILDAQDPGEFKVLIEKIGD
ncbi:MAG: SAM-dependent chlorinase/fluorinase [Oscillospiraceae bacterium]